MGGGSSDAAFMLKLLNEHFQLIYLKISWEIYAQSRLRFFIRNVLDLCRRNRQHFLLFHYP